MKRLVSSFFILIFFISQYSSATEIIDNVDFNKKWSGVFGDEQRNLQLVIDILKQSRQGRYLIEQSLKKASDSKMSQIVLPGEYSLTDTTLIRRFSKNNPYEVEYESLSKVYLDRSLSIKNAVLDLAHELTHYLHREPFNPYRDDYNLDDFILSTIEGKGGEIQAFMSECLVAYELFGASDQRLCQRVADETGRPSIELATKEFYKVGKYFEDFSKKLKSQGNNTKQKLSGEASTFISSAYGQPYPVAAFNEYIGVMRRVCENDRKRLSYLKENQGRSPAALEQTQAMAQSLNKRCQQLL